MKYILLITLLIGQFNVSGQWLKKKKLYGQWKISNNNNSYFSSDTLSIDNDFKFEAIPQDGCKFVLWEIGAEESKIFTYDNCDGKWTKKLIDDKVLIELKDIDGGYFVLVQDQNNKIIKEKFSVNYYTEDKGTIKGKKWKAFGLARVK
jgi:hypothetical protein